MRLSLFLFQKLTEKCGGSCGKKMLIHFSEVKEGLRIYIWNQKMFSALKKAWLRASRRRVVLSIFNQIAICHTEKRKYFFLKDIFANVTFHTFRAFVFSRKVQHGLWKMY